MLASGLGMGPETPPADSGATRPASMPGAPEPYPEGGATLLAAGLGTVPAEAPSPAGSVPLPPSAEPFASSSFSDASATLLASGFGVSKASHTEPFAEDSPAPAPPPSPGESGQSSGPGATMFASAFGLGDEHEPTPSHTPAPSASSEAGSYPPGEATMLARSLMGEPERPPKSAFQTSSESSFESAPESGPAPTAAPIFSSPDTGLPAGDATRLASGGAPPWESAPPPVAPGEAPYAPPAPSHSWTGGSYAGPPASGAEVESPPVPVDPAPAAAPRKANWVVWAAVPVVAIVLGVGAWYFLGHTGGAQVSSPPATPSPAPETTAPTASPAAGAGSGPQSPAQQAPGAATPATGVPAEGAATGAAAKPEESKPTETKAEETKPAEKKPVDMRAVQALKTEGDLDYDKGLYDDAIRAYRKGLALDPGNKMLIQQINRARKAKQTEEKLLH